MRDLPDQLEGLHRQMETLSPQLYRHLALYLQVLRQVLPGRVDQAVFHLATQIHPDRYTALPGRQREHFHRRLSLLVDRCCSLLTVEQLSTLAARIDRETRVRRAANAGLLRRSADGASLPRQDLPDGSVQLGLDTPLVPAWMSGWGSGDWLGPAQEAEPRPDDPLVGAPRQEHTPPDDEPVAEPEDRDSPEDEPFGAAADPAGPSPPGLWGLGPLPRDPQLQLRWLAGMEAALLRRLRNLSHALNVELLRAGLSRSLLPVSLLDAVLEGQLETSAAPANLLRLPLPFGPSPDGESIEALAILLRCADIEMEEPRLRTCRRRLDLHRQELRRMARQFRRLQRRHQAHQAEQLWLQDLRTTRHPGG